MKTTIMLIRHGEALGNYIRHFHGFFNAPLTDKGKIQAARLAQRMKDERIDVFFSSDLDRAYDTACAVNEFHNLPITKDPLLREINGGKWEDTHWDDLPVLYPEIYDKWLNNPIETCLPDGETMVDFCERITKRVCALAEKYEGKTICIACHGTVIRTLVCFFSGKPFSELNDIEWCDNASLTTAEYEGGKFTLKINGENDHLKDISTVENQAWWIDRQKEKK